MRCKQVKVFFHSSWAKASSFHKQIASSTFLDVKLPQFIAFYMYHHFYYKI